MKYTELSDSTDFHRNMRKTPWLKLFPHWWDEKDALLNAIGDEVERIKATAIFSLLNAGIKPPVMIWQESLKHEKYNINKDITQFPTTIEMPAPFYKTWGDITLTNNTTDDIDGIEITFDGKNGFMINQMISKGDIIKIDLSEDKVYINNHSIKPQIIGQGMPFFLTTQNNATYKEDTPLHNEIVRLKINTDVDLEDTIITNTINITENIDDWSVSGNAYEYNKEEVDPWIAMENNTRIGYELDFTDIEEISFLYKGDKDSTLSCYIGRYEIFSKKLVDNKFHNYTIDTANIQYEQPVTDVATNETTYELRTAILSGIDKIEFVVSDTEGVTYLNDIKYVQHTKYNSKCDINVDINMNDVVFINEQNIEVTGLELIPIEKIELYAKYDFDYNSSRNGWQKVYQKKYDSKTNVVYDMVTTHFYTKEFYVDVWFKTLQYPYKVGFPCNRNADIGSEYHVNNRLDTWGEQLGLERRIYKDEIDEKDYPDTFPTYYPYNIEQDYWYYRRLVNEYTWNDSAINDIDIKDTEDNNVLRLYSINPFCEDFVVHAESHYPVDKEFIDYNEYYPVAVRETTLANYKAQSSYSNITNLLGNTRFYSSILLNNQSDNNDVLYKQIEQYYRNVNHINKDVQLTAQQIKEIQESTQSNINYIKNSAHISKTLWTFFDLTDLPENVNIDDITITIEAESTDNKTNKFSTEDTGLVIPHLENEEEDYFIPLTADKSYQMRKQSITYSIPQSYNLNKIISGVDSHTAQEATIGKFEAKEGNYAYIPFTLTENGTRVKDINEIYIYYTENIIKIGRIVEDKDKNTYIKVFVPHNTPFNNMKIACKSKTHMPFSTTINIAPTIIYKDENNKEIDYKKIIGPLTDGKQVTLKINDEWHTKDIRNILQRQGIYFKNIFTNTDPQSSTTILLYNIKLKIDYSPKNSNFNLTTNINVRDAEKPNIGIYEVDIENTGEKPLKTSIDIITPPNIKIEQNYIDVNLGVGEGLSNKFKITPEYPIIDGFYDIITSCGDVIKTNSINVFSDALIKTSVDIQPHTGKYNEIIPLTATVNAIDKSIINGAENVVQFYINGYAVGNPVEVINNKATVNLEPGNYKFTGTGTLLLEAQYIGNTKYANSRGSNTIFIGKNNTRITIDTPDKVLYHGAYQAKAIVEYYNGEEYKPVDDGAVTFYINNEILATTIENYNNGVFIASIDKIENPPKEYTLRVQYEGSAQFAAVEEETTFEIIGGDVQILFFDEIIRPKQNIKLKAKILDHNNKSISLGYLDFYNEELNITGDEFKNIPIINGIGTTPEIPINVKLDDDEDSKTYNIEITHHIFENQYGESDKTSIGYVKIQKGDVNINHSPVYQASQYEPLGFFLSITDAETDEPVKEGKIEITLPNQDNIKILGDVDEDGCVRIVDKIINFTGAEWQELYKWSLSTNDDNSLGQKDIIGETYNPDNLYKIYDGDWAKEAFMDFELQNGQLYYHNKKREDNDSTNHKEHIYIGSDGHLYAKTDISEIRNYKIGLQDIIIKFYSNDSYRPRTINIANGLNVTTQKADLDIHSYEVSYTNTSLITCYVTKYENEGNELITDGKIHFLCDNILVDVADVINGKAIFHNDALSNIKTGKHLFEVNYVKDDKVQARSYSFITLLQSTPTLTLVPDRISRNKNTKITAYINSESNLNIPLDGSVKLYMEHDNIIEKIGEQYLYGNEKIDGIVDYENEIPSTMLHDTYSVVFNYIMPEDIDRPDVYKLKAIYEGNDFFSPSNCAELNICEETTNVVIDSHDIDIDKNINIAVNEECNIDFTIQAYDDVINEGILYLVGGKDKDNKDIIIASGHVIDNQATLSWTPDIKQENYSLTLRYDDAIHYKKKEMQITFNIISPINSITLPTQDYKTLKQAIMCIKNEGTIFLTEDIELNKDLSINKNCNIIGHNDISIINMTTTPLNININNSVHFNNIHFVSEYDEMKIINNEYLIIYHSILDKNIHLHNENELIAQRNFIYGTCTGAPSDLDNNWWGSNTPKYDVNNHIIIQVRSSNSPAVISEEINIIGEMIGANNREYNLPEANFTFGSDTGYFSTSYGTTINHKIETTYLDAEKEGNIYFTVDNETATCPVYDYERKTEVIIDNIYELPLNYQIPITAKVQSCADIFYEFDSNNNITKSTNNINEGYISFYIDDNQVGYSPVQNGEASTVVFLTNKYYTNKKYQLKAIYTPKEYYFSSESTLSFEVIDDADACYVSSQGTDDNDGTYDMPVKTIQHAIELQKNTIYLLDNNYNETNINITHSLTIKSFKNSATFDSLSGNYLFNIQSDAILKCFNIDCINNTVNALFNTQGTLRLNECILYKNKNIFDNTNNICIKYSAIVDNENIANNINHEWFKYCWFGQNNPDIDNIDYHVQMNIEKSKDILYVGTLAHITGLLNTYKHGIIQYKLEKPLPLRIAKFSTTYGSMKPIKDYTYNNSSTSLLNTQTNNNTTQYIVAIPENKNYIDSSVTLQCSVKNVYDDYASGVVEMVVSNDSINIKRIATLENGIATITLNPLNLGVYTLTCTYIDDNNAQHYTSMRDFVVQKPEIKVTKFQVSDGDNLYHTTLNIELEDNFGNKIDNEPIDIYIDKKYITTIIVNKGIINETITYNLIPEGQHEISINNSKKSQYSDFIYYQPLNVTMKHINKNKEIIFNYDNFEIGIENNVHIYIKDDEGVNIDGGYVNVELDNNNILSNAPVVNGHVSINDFIINEAGQHTIAIYYSGIPGYYYEEVFINNYIGAGIFNVIFGISNSQYIKANIGKPLALSTTVTDISGAFINQGYVNIYIDDILVEEGIYINDGQLNINTELPVNTQFGLHSLCLKYIDSTDMYLDTLFYTFIEVGKIPTEINIDTIYGAPGQNTAVNYSISTIYGSVNSGELIAKYENNIISRSSVTDNINNQIIIPVPFVPNTDNYIIDFEYTDNTYYGNSFKEIPLLIRRNKVNIEPSHTQYYPNQQFYFVATITDKDNNMVNYGKASLYIDNVQETEPQNVINGQIKIPLLLKQARQYRMSVLYKDNEYYEETEYPFIFNVNSIDINDIYIKENTTQYPKYYVNNNSEIYSLPNQIIDLELVFDTFDNFNVKDGIISIEVDGNTIDNYHIAESNKYIRLNTNNLSKGEHELLLKYSESSLFKNKESKPIKLHIIAKQLKPVVNENKEITVYDYNDTIDIRTLLYDIDGIKPINTTGMIRNYIGLPIHKVDEIGNTSIVYDYHFIGVNEIKNSNEAILSYKLPNNLLEYSENMQETIYKIKSEFTGNNEYDEQESIPIDLKIKKQESKINFNVPAEEYYDINYRGTIDIPFTINVPNNPLVQFYINDDNENNLIGSVIAKNGTGRITYKMNSEYSVRQGDSYYKLIAVFDGSAINKPTSKSLKIRVGQLEPTVRQTDKIAYYGGTLKLDTVVTDDTGVLLNEGILTYKMGDNTVQANLNEGAEIQIPPTTAQSINLLVSFDTTVPNYKVFNNKPITILLQKNNIELEITAPEKIHRYEQNEITVRATSPTTTLPLNNLTFNGQEMTNGEVTIPFTYSNQDYTSTYTFTVTSSGNDFFTSVSKPVKIEVVNQEEVTLNISAAESATNANTLAKALNLVNEYGTINIIKPPQEQHITLNKNVNITGKNIDVIDWQITNENNEINIQGINFKNSESNAIINNNKLNIRDCSFSGGKDSAIYSNGSIHVDNCKFKNNKAKNGAAIYISNRNYNTIIENCTFTENECQYYENYVSGNGSCIYLNKANDVEILNNTFKNNTGENDITSSIYVYGNAHISSNSFYNNQYYVEINIINGIVSLDKNIFSGAIPSIYVLNGTIDADLNYWGYNDIEQIEDQNRIVNDEDTPIQLDNWLISRRLDYNKVIDGEEKTIIVGVIDQYINRLEKEITTIETIKADFLVLVGSNNVFSLNQEIHATPSAAIYIGQEKLLKKEVDE